jgi:pseudaminic acid cytidylyltransferase
MANIAIIPARGGSKRIPRKNIKYFCGKPVIYYAIKNALSCGLFDEVMVSTDDLEIAAIAKKYGAKVPFMRSSKNSEDNATTADVINEVILYYRENNLFFDSICCIYPATPLLEENKIIDGYNEMVNNHLDSVVPLVRYSNTIERSYQINDKNKAFCIDPNNSRINTQKFKSSYFDPGQFYWVKEHYFLKTNKLIADTSGFIILDEFEIQDIDNESDWDLALLKFKTKKIYNKIQKQNIKLKKVSKIILGTAQFGLDYGITNKTGITTENEIKSILNYAKKQAIYSLDTALDYGVSEYRISKFSKNRFEINSKCQPAKTENEFRTFFFKSLQSLEVDSINSYMIHRYDNAFIENLSYLNKLKDEGRIKKTGLSLNTTDELKTLLDKNFIPDIIQMPFNLLNREFEEFFPLLNQMGIEIQIRSIFLQGLLLTDFKNFPEKLNLLQSTIKQISKKCNKYNVSINGLALYYVLNKEYVDHVVVGVNNLAQLQENLTNYLNTEHIEELISFIDNLQIEKTDLLNPIFW